MKFLIVELSPVKLSLYLTITPRAFIIGLDKQIYFLSIKFQKAQDVYYTLFLVKIIFMAKEEGRLRVFENRALRRTFGSKRDTGLV